MIPVFSFSRRHVTFAMVYEGFRGARRFRLTLPALSNGRRVVASFRTYSAAVEAALSAADAIAESEG